MVFLVEVKNSLKGKEGTLLAMVKTGNKSIINQHLNNDLMITVKKPEDVKILKEVKGVEISTPSSVVILQQLEATVAGTYPTDDNDDSGEGSTKSIFGL